MIPKLKMENRKTDKLNQNGLITWNMSAPGHQSTQLKKYYKTERRP